MEKYLNSVEEVVKALEEGKKILDIANMDCYYKLVAGKYCYCDLKYNTTVINISIVFEDNSKRYYTEEAEPLKFEVNRAYETRNGLKAFLDCKVDGGFNFLLRDDNYCTDLDGKYFKNQEHRNDIVGYWEEEK